MKIISLSFFIILISKITIAGDCVFTKTGYSYCEPYDCNAILELKKYQLTISSIENLGNLQWQCRAYTAGKTLKKGKDTAIDTGKKLGGQILEKSGLGSFLKGWGN